LLDVVKIEVFKKVNFLKIKLIVNILFIIIFLICIKNVTFNGIDLSPIF